uniref:Glycosyltransferase n=1 Tax=Parastrongyloides trichosuri TaxID=131310 RepID=A0A0N4Z8T1_PARTI
MYRFLSVKKLFRTILTFIIILFFIILLTSLRKFTPNSHLLKLDKIPIKRSRIAIVMVMDELVEDEYTQAIRTLYCYTVHYRYSFIIINKKNNLKYFQQCVYRDFMFQRHCIISKFSYDKQHLYDYIIFIDGDVAVINPIQTIEKYLPKGKEEIIFYDRIYNKEISAGSYIMRNSKYSRDFLMFFANYDFKIPFTNDGRDNVALQSVFVDFVMDRRFLKEYDLCRWIWSTSIGFDTNMVVVSCMRWILEKYNESNDKNDYSSFDNGKLIILSKTSKRRWIRDTWLCDWKFCDDDFLLHGWKTSEIEKAVITFDKEFNPTTTTCLGEKFLSAWSYNDSSVVSCSEIDYSISLWIEYAIDNDIKDLNTSGILKLET